MVNLNPLVTIVIPCYNCESTVLEAIQSALNQSYKNIEVIVINDGSVDNSKEIIIQELSKDTRLTYQEQDNKGLSAARNLGLHFAQGEFIVFLDADDILKDSYVQISLGHYYDNPNLIIVYSNMELFERETGVLYLPKFEINLFLMRNCIPAFAMVRTSQIKEIGGFDEAVKLCEDWECWMHLLKCFNGEVLRIEEPLYNYRKRFSADSIMDQNKNNVGDEVLLYVYNKHYELYKRYGFLISNLVRDRNQLKQIRLKYYNVWYRKLIYKVFKPNKYRQIMNKLRF
jgi:glycosyltransferase involved in cell wall biosynthesis